jgi:DNA-binding response OmpR family regulator
LLFGADDFVAKPFITEFLLQKINGNLEGVTHMPTPVIDLPPVESLQESASAPLH